MNGHNAEPSTPGVGPLNREFARVAWMAGTGDGPPAQSLVESVDQYCQALGKELQTWTQINSTTVPEINRQLQQVKAQPLPAVKVNPGCR